MKYEADFIYIRTDNIVAVTAKLMMIAQADPHVAEAKYKQLDLVHMSNPNRPNRIGIFKAPPSPRRWVITCADGQIYNVIGKNLLEQLTKNPVYLAVKQYRPGDDPTTEKVPKLETADD